MKPRAYITDGSEMLIGIGSAHSMGDAERPRGKLRGHIVIPDVDERRGWREWYVYDEPDPAPPRPLGFRKP